METKSYDMLTCKEFFEKMERIKIENNRKYNLKKIIYK